MADRRYRVRWKELGCPTEPGTYNWNGKPVQIMGVHIQAAGRNPDAICTLICWMPGGGSELCVAGEVEQPYG
jgi:hypothetical protein